MDHEHPLRQFGTPLATQPTLITVADEVKAAFSNKRPQQQEIPMTGIPSLLRHKSKSQLPATKSQNLTENSFSGDMRRSGLSTSIALGSVVASRSQANPRGARPFLNFRNNLKPRSTQDSPFKDVEISGHPLGQHTSTIEDPPFHSTPFVNRDGRQDAQMQHASVPNVRASILKVPSQHVSTQRPSASSDHRTVEDHWEDTSVHWSACDITGALGSANDIVPHAELGRSDGSSPSPSHHSTAETSHDYNSSGRPLVHPLATDHVAACSRSGSMISTSVERFMEDDPAVMMMRGVTELRTMRVELEDQRRENRRLHSQLLSLATEKTDLAKNLSRVKQTAKQGLESSAKRLEEMGSEFDVLRRRSQDVFAFVSQAQASLPEVQEIRGIVSQAIKDVEPLLSGNGQDFLAAETKAIVNELQAECTNKQQVLDLLRQRLETVHGEFVEAKNRVSELEMCQTNDRGLLKTSFDNMAGASLRLAELANSLKTQQLESIMVLSKAADLEAQLDASNLQLSDLNEVILAKDLEIQAAQDLRTEISKLKALLEHAETELISLHSVKEELVKSTTLLVEREAGILALKDTLHLKSQDGAVAQENLRAAAVQLVGKDDRIQKIEDDLRSTQEREQHLNIRIMLAGNEKETLERQVEASERQITDLRAELVKCSDRAQQAHIRSQVIQERFDDQSVTLRITKEANGDLQERLSTAEIEFARQLDTKSGKLEIQIARLQEREALIQRRLEEATASFKSQEAENVVTLTKLEEKREKSDDRLRAEEIRVLQAERNLEGARRIAQDLQAQLSDIRDQNNTLCGQLREAATPSLAHQAELDNLRLQVKELETSEEILLEKARSINIRYKSGDLTAEEKTFVNDMLQTAHSIHEHELVSKANELRKRDNAIKTLQARNNLLESTLARHLNTQAKANADTSVADQSMIDLASWMSSQSDGRSSMHSAGLQAPDRDVPSTNDDNTAGTTPAPARAPPRRLSPFIPVVPAVRPTHQGPERSPRSPAPASAGRKGAFARLDTDASDELDDFDDRNKRLDADQIATSKSNLGKREREKEDGKEGEQKLAGKTGRRTKSVRKQAQQEEVTPTSKAVEVALKSKRKRR